MISEQKTSDPAEDNLTEDYKRQVEDEIKRALALQEFWKEWMPGGLRKRKRYRTKGHGQRRAERRRKGRAAKIARRANRRAKKKGRNK